MTVYASVQLQDLAELKVQVSHITGRLHSPRKALQSVPLPGRMGAAVTDIQSAGAKEITIRGTIFNPTLLLVDRQTAEDGLKDLMYGHRVRVQISDGYNTPRVIDGYVTGMGLDPRGLTLVAYSTEFSITLLCPDGVWRDVNPRLVGLSGTGRDILIGTAPSSPIVRFMGAATPVVNPVLKILDQTGAVIRSITLTVSLSDDDWVEHDCSTAQTTKYIDSVVGVVDNTLVTAGDDLFAIEPRFGYRQFGLYPQALLTSDSGTPTGVMQYTAAWL